MIRDFIKSDFNDYINMSKQMYNSEATMHNVPEKNFINTFDNIMNNSPFVRGLIIEREGKTVGYGLLSFTYSNEAGGNVVLLEELFIINEYRGHGIGESFFKFVHSEYANNTKRFRLEVSKNNLNVVNFYKRMGYEEFDYFQMVKDL